METRQEVSRRSWYSLKSFLPDGVWFTMTTAMEIGERTQLLSPIKAKLAILYGRRYGHLEEQTIFWPLLGKMAGVQGPYRRTSAYRLIQPSNKP